MDEGGRGAPALTRQLADLKRRGCALLVVNDAGGAARMCRHLLGAPGLERRHCFLATTVGVPDLLARHGATPPDPDAVGVVDASRATPTRSAAVSAGPAAAVDPGAEWYTRVEDLDDLHAVGEGVVGHVRRLAPEEPDPAQLRFCLEGLDPFVAALDREELFRFVHLLASAVRAARGLAHVHVSSGVDPVDRELLAPLFDGTVRVRAHEDGRVEQRWHVHESGYTTDWLPVEESPLDSI